MCGEEHTLIFLDCGELGSPPHVRGRGSFATHSGCARRITPACAGKSLILASSGEMRRDHPRMCGEELPEEI